MKVVILRGLPGSGKSTWAEKQPLAFICSADKFFEDESGYHFDPSKLKDAHAWCFKRFKEAIAVRMSLIIVDNTNTTTWEYARYADLAIDQIDCELEIRSFFGGYASIHDVPAKTIKRMLDRWEPVPPQYYEYGRKHVEEKQTVDTSQAPR